MDNLTWKQWHEQQTNYDYTGNTLQPTTWAVCWVCGKKIAANHSKECIEGVHKKCTTANRMYMGDVVGKFIFDLQPENQQVQLTLIIY